MSKKPCGNCDKGICPKCGHNWPAIFISAIEAEADKIDCETSGLAGEHLGLLRAITIIKDLIRTGKA